MRGQWDLEWLKLGMEICNIFYYRDDFVSVIHVIHVQYVRNVRLAK